MRFDWRTAFLPGLTSILSGFISSTYRSVILTSLARGMGSNLSFLVSLRRFERVVRPRFDRVVLYLGL